MTPDGERAANLEASRRKTVILSAARALPAAGGFRWPAIVPKTTTTTATAPIHTRFRMAASVQFAKGFENFGSDRNARSVSVFRNAVSAIFSDEVKFNGPTGLS